MAKSPPALQIMVEYYDLISRMPDEDAGKLLKGLFEFQVNGTKPKFAEEYNPLGFAFTAISNQVQRSNERYEEICKKNSENARKRTQTDVNVRERTQATVKNGLHSQPIVNESESVSENENVVPIVNSNADVCVCGGENGKESGGVGERGVGEEGVEGKGKPKTLLSEADYTAVKKQRHLNN